MSSTREVVLDTLGTVIDPISGKDIVSAGMVRGLIVEGPAVRFVIEAHSAHAGRLAETRAEAEKLVAQLPGIDTVSVVLTAHQSSPDAPPDLKPARAASNTGPGKLPGVDKIVAIASGKGGVGKSTVAANLAVALASLGCRTGLLDGDVYGPSQPRMLSISGRPSSPDGKTILPLRNLGVTMMSMGLLTAEDEAVVWRGPMLMGALSQMLTQVQWGALDIMLVDLPPGTGDVQMTLCQRVQVHGAIIVCTPQDIALLDTRKGIDMFNTMKVPILGMVENMSTHECTNCGHVEHLFGQGGVAAEAEKLGVPLLANIPLDIKIRTGADAGIPVVASHPGKQSAMIFQNLARQVRKCVAT